MTTAVTSLGYLRLGATDLDRWADFAQRVLGLMVADQTSERLLLRMDHHAYRLDIVAADQGGVQAVGWEVDGPASLRELVSRLEAEGHHVEWLDDGARRHRMVSEVVRFRDPDGALDLELFWGLKNATARFASPIGASFVAGGLGLGHVFQVVNDEEAHQHLYMDVLGFRLSDHIDFTADTVGTFLHCNPRHHSFAFSDNPKRPKGVGHFMMEVTELDVLGRAMDIVDAENVKIVQTFGRHTNDKMVSQYILTPSDVALEFGTGGILIDDETWRPTRYDAAHYWGHKRDE